MMKNYFVLSIILCVTSFSTLKGQTDLIISEYVEGWGNNKVIELYNPTNTGINLKDYVIKRYSNGSTSASSDYTVAMPDKVLEPYKTFVITQDKRESAGTVPADDSPIWAQVEARADYFVPSDYGSGEGTKCIHWNGDDAVTLEKTDGSKVDIFGKTGEQPAAAAIPGSTETIGSWTDTPPYFTGAGIGLSADHTLVRKPSVNSGVTSNPSLFNIVAEYDTFTVSTFYNLGWHTMNGAPANADPVVDVNETYMVSSSVTNGTKIMTVGYNDTDADQTMKFFGGNGNFIYIGEGDDAIRHTPFALDRVTGELTVIDAAAIALFPGDTVFVEVYVCDEYSQSAGVSFDVVITDEILSNAKTNTAAATLAPNPAQDYFVIKGGEVIREIQVWSLTGRELFRQVANTSNVRVNIDLPAGSYLVKTTFAGNNVGVNKLIIK